VRARRPSQKEKEREKVMEMILGLLGENDFVFFGARWQQPFFVGRILQSAQPEHRLEVAFEMLLITHREQAPRARHCVVTYCITQRSVGLYVSALGRWALLAKAILARWFNSTALSTPVCINQCRAATAISAAEAKRHREYVRMMPVCVSLCRWIHTGGRHWCRMLFTQMSAAALIASALELPMQQPTVCRDQH
jgi:hypothetical protein